MLNGVGGQTIEQAKELISYQEFVAWCKYRKEFGSLNSSVRNEWGFALLACIYMNSHSKNSSYTVYDFAPHIKEPEITIEDAMKKWK